MNLELLQPFGLKITPKDNCNSISSIAKNFLFEAIYEKKLVLLRGFNSLPKEELIDFAKQFGSLLEWEFGNVMEMKVDDNAKNYLFTHSNVPFHWDGAFHQVPDFLLFNCIQAPLKNCGGETLFTDTEKLYELATSEEKKLYENLNIIYETEKLAHYGGKITVPLVQKHFKSGKAILRFAEPVPENYLNPVKVSIRDLSAKRSEQIIKSIALKCYESKVCYSHEWKNNDILISDNFSLIHGRNQFAAFSPRHLRRIQLIINAERNI